ncbi:hypothetical protein [Thomasclavelia sp.]|uniref:hypothetical protein n=1 Tax=Thomasclavelia sp. TaxID=3025757 RepID=UPI0025F3E8C5|nr:hypothetical protein [Thomasclavelia sp.]
MIKNNKKFVFNIPDEISYQDKYRDQNEKNIKEAKEILNNADAIVVGIGSGLSSACGYNYYHENEFFDKHFSKYRQKYGYNNLFFGLNYVYSNYEEQWSFIADYVQCMLNEKGGKPYQDLADLVKLKPHFILTTNIDTQVSKVFLDDNIWTFQGDVRFLQCSQPCHDQLYPITPALNYMLKGKSEYVVQPDSIPRCPHCHRIMRLWVRDETFLEGKKWQKQRQNYQNFIKTYQNENIVFLELGVGNMTPSIIKFPFWQMTKKMDNAKLISINYNDTSLPEHVRDKTVLLTMNLKDALKILNEI